MRIRQYSDLHINFGAFDSDLTNVDVLVLSGDTGEGKDLYNYANRCLNAYKNLHIVAVAGNHEFYSGQDMQTLIEFYKTVHMDRFHFLENSSVIIKGVKFIGATLWTDYFKENPLYIRTGWASMNDYVYCSYLGRKLTPTDTIDFHKKSRKYIFDELAKKECEKQIVVTHHKPYLSEMGELACCYESDLPELNDIRPNIWFYGHTHKHDETQLYDDMKVISNPRGYAKRAEAADFNPDLIVEI